MASIMGFKPIWEKEYNQDCEFFGVESSTKHVWMIQESKAV